MAEDQKNHSDEQSKFIRRSFRLQNKPQPEYDFKNYLKDEITCLIKNKEKQGTKKSAEVTNKKYDDIFNAVVAEAYQKCVEKTSKPTISTIPKTMSLWNDLLLTSDIVEFTSDSEDNDDVICDGILRISNNDVKTIKITRKTFSCSCGECFINHDDCHKHMLQKHNDQEVIVTCQECFKSSKQVYSKHTCTVCGEYSNDLNEHVASHYRMSTSKRAVMECRFCVKQFLTVQEVMAHEKIKHLTKNVNLKRPRKYHQCKECLWHGNSYDQIASHYATHFNLDLIWKEIETLQEVDKGCCPFCNYSTATNKTFKEHILKFHYIKCKDLATKNNQKLLDKAIKKEIMDILNSETVNETKEIIILDDVKEEIIDEEYEAQS